MTSLENIDCAVIGAGVVGLAVARALAMAGREVVVLEATGAIGTGTSSRNSEVIHAGIYYPKESLKAKLCVSGKQLLYDYCPAHGVDHQQCGKLIVATSDTQLDTLADIKEKADNNGVPDLRHLTVTQVSKLEPDLTTKGALLSPSTGIIDTHGLMLAYQGDAEDHGTMIAFNAPVTGGNLEEKGIRLFVGGADELVLQCNLVVNCGGLFAQNVAASIQGFPREYIPESYYAKGNYFVLNRKSPFSHLIYPVPEQAGLGVHLTLDLAGQARFGPDVEWINDVEYSVNPERVDSFYNAIRKYWPALPDASLSPGYSGIRPKLNDQNHPASDFVIDGPETHGVEGLINLFGIESPGITASLAIAGHVSNLISQ